MTKVIPEASHCEALHVYALICEPGRGCVPVDPYEAIRRMA